MKLVRGMKVVWPSRHNGAHLFKGTILRVIEDRAIVDDDLGLTYRTLPVEVLIVTGDPTRISGIRK